MGEVQRPVSWRIRTDTERKLVDALDAIRDTRELLKAQNERLISAQGLIDVNAEGVTRTEKKADQAITDAGTARTVADTSQQIAGSKNRVWVQASAPTPSATGDMWIDTTNNNLIKTWNGSSWAPSPLGVNAIDGVKASVVTGQIVSSQITSGAIVADKIDAQAVTATKLASNSVTADKIESRAMTAKNFYSQLDGNSRIVIGPDATMSGRPRITFDKNGNGVDLNDGYLGMEQSSNELTLDGGGSTNGPGHTGIYMGSPAESAATARIYMVASNASTQNDITISPTRTDFFKDCYFQGWIQSETLKTNLDASVVNIAAGPSGTLKRSSASSERYKMEIGPITDPALDPLHLLDIPVRQFKFRENYLMPGSQRADTLLPGLIAEEVASVYPIAVDLDDEGIPENWGERFLFPGLLALVQQLWDRVTDLEERLGQP